MSYLLFPPTPCDLKALIESLPLEPNKILKASPVPGTGVTGYSTTVRNNYVLENGNNLITCLHPQLATLHHLFANAVATYPNNDCIGLRRFNPVTGTNDPTYTWESFVEVDERKRNLGSGILHVVRNSPFRTEAHDGDKFIVGLYSGNRAEWLYTDLACQSFSLTNTALYDTLGPETSRYILSLCESPIVVCAKDKLQHLLDIQREQRLPKLLCLVSMDAFTQEEHDHYQQQAKSLRLELFDLSQVEAIGQRNPLPERPPTPDDLYTISFTSGTTGNPKGVEVHHGMGASGVAMYLAQADIPKGEGHELCFLPLAHIYERGLLAANLAIGVGFGFPVECSVATLVAELKALKPTTLASVPRVYSKMEAEIKEATINLPNEILRAVAKLVVEHRWERIRTDSGFRNNIASHEAFTSELKKSLGLEKARMMYTGSAPISPATVDFMKSVLDIGVVEAYGLTESFGIMCMSNPFSADSGSCGIPGVAGEMRLRDVPEMGYSAKDPEGPRGELLLRGPQIFRRYYKNEEATAEAFDADGWFCTGDVARFDPKGRVSIVDRVKAMGKNSLGEYISPERSENIYLSSSTLVNQLFIHIDPLENFLVAVAGYNPEVMARFLGEQFGIALDPQTQLAQIDAKVNEMLVKTRILQVLTELVRPAKLAGFEKIHNIWFEREPLSVAREVYTPTFKLKRPACRKFFATQLKAMIEEGSILKGAKL